MAGIKISDLPRIAEISGDEEFVLAHESDNWTILLEQIRGRIIFPEDYGAAGDGRADDGEALAAAVAAAARTRKPLMLVAGNYRVTRDLAIDVPVYFLGGKLIIDPAARVTINGRLTAPPEQIFQGPILGTLNATEVYPEWFGARGGNYADTDSHDDTEAVQAAIDASGGGVLKLNSLYRVKPNSIAVHTANSGLHIIGQTGAAMRGPKGAHGQHDLDRPSGLLLLESGDWMLRLGSTDGERGCFQIVLQDIVLDGGHHKCNLGLLWAQAVSQTKFERIAVRNVRGPGMFANKLEDVNITNCQFGKLGDVENVWGYFGGILFGAPPKYAGIGSNVVFFHACRFEWMDGGYFRIVREPAEDPTYSFNNNSIPYVHHLHFVQCKTEVGQTEEEGEAYGDSRNRWAVFEFGAAQHGATEKDTKDRDRPRFVNNILVTACHFNGIHHARTFVRAGTLENLFISGNNITFSPHVQNPQSLFELMDNDGKPVDCMNFVMRDNLAWVKGKVDGFGFTYEDKSAYEIHYEPPLLPKLKKPKSETKTD